MLTVQKRLLFWKKIPVKNYSKQVECSFDNPDDMLLLSDRKIFIESPEKNFIKKTKAQKVPLETQNAVFENPAENFFLKVQFLGMLRLHLKFLFAKEI